MLRGQVTMYIAPGSGSAVAIRARPKIGALAGSRSAG